MSDELYKVAVDFGSHSIKIAVGKKSDNPDDDVIQILSLVGVDSAGIKKGVITNMHEASQSLHKAIQQTSDIIGFPIDSAMFGINGSGVKLVNSQGLIVNTNNTGEIEERDVERLKEDARKKAFGINDSTNLHTIPKKYKIDNQDGIQNPVGMAGTRLEATVLFIEGDNTYLKNFSKVIIEADIGMEENPVFLPYTSSNFLLSDSQKKSGAVLIDIGFNSTSYIVWENDEVLATGVIPVGSWHVTQDLALGLGTTPEMAEQIKKQHINFTPESEMIPVVEMYNQDTGETEKIDLSDATCYAKARVEEIFTFVNKELKKIGKSGKLAGGAVLVGGGSNLKGILEVAKNVLHIPVFKHRIDPNKIVFVSDFDDDPSVMNVISLVAHQLNTNEEMAAMHNLYQSSSSLNNNRDRKNIFKELIDSVKGFFNK